MCVYMYKDVYISKPKTMKNIIMSKGLQHLFRNKGRHQSAPPPVGRDHMTTESHPPKKTS